MRSSVGVVVALFVGALSAPAWAQSPNTASLQVQVVDQTGALVKDAKVSIVNAQTGAARDLMSSGEGSAIATALSITGTYTVRVTKAGFTAQEVKDLSLQAGEAAQVKVKLVASGGASEVTVYGTSQGVRADSQIGKRIDSLVIDQAPILGRKVTSLPLLNAAFRQAKGTGDLFVNATYFVTGAGGRRQTSVMVDGSNNDEAWGRQTMQVAVPVGAIREITALSNAFSAEYGWTSSAVLNIVTKSGTNTVHGEGLFMNRPGKFQANSFSATGFCAPSVPTCVTPPGLATISPADIPDKLNQYSVTFGAPIVKDKTFFFASTDYTMQDRTAQLSSALPAFLLPADGSLLYVGLYRQSLFNGRLDHKITPDQTLTVRFNSDRFYDTNPQDAVGGTSAPSVARKYSRRAWSTQVSHTSIITSNLLNETRLAYLDGDPVTLWEAQNLSTAYTRSGSVPFTVGQSRITNAFSRQTELADTLSWSHGMHTVRFGGSVDRNDSGGSGGEPGTAVLGTFTFKNTTTAPFDQLTLADVQSYSQPLSYGATSFDLKQWLFAGFVQDSIRMGDLTVDAGVRYDRQTLTDAKKNFAPRIGFGWHPAGDSKTAIRGGYGMYYTQIRSNEALGPVMSGLDGLTSYSATPGQTGFPTCLTGACLPLQFDPRILPASQVPARSIQIRAGRRAFYEQQFAQYGLNFDLLPNYPDSFVNPRSQVMSIGAEREIMKGLFVGSDYVHQHWTNLDRTVDLNAPSIFDRTAPGQTRSVAAANATRPIVPVNGGVNSVNVLMNLGVADYDGLQTQVSYRGNSEMYVAVGYTLSKATNTSEPDGNGINPNQANIAALGEQERGPSLLDQRHRVVITFTHKLPYNMTAGTVTQLASGRPFNATTGVDNNGDGANNDRPVVNGVVIGKSAFRMPGTQDVSVFLEGRLRRSSGGRMILLRLEGFNILNHANILGRGQTTYGDTGVVNTTFGQVASVAAGVTNAIPAFANIDPPRMFQFQVRFVF